MAENGKIRLLTTMDIFLHETDAEHPLTVPQLTERLSERGCFAERKTVMADIKALSEYGFHIENRRGPGGGYYLCEREFETVELKMLVDAVQAAKFVSQKRSRELLSKLYRLTSDEYARQLKRYVYVDNRVKSENKSIFYSIDAIYTAIGDDTEIGFRYLRRGMDKKPVERRGGKTYIVSPFALVWDDENYYLIAYDGESGLIKHYRVDKMRDVKVLSTQRHGKETFACVDMALYTKKTFGMYSGEEESVTLSCEASLADVILDRFGEDITLRPSEDKQCFLLTQRVRVSPVFLSWVMGFGGKMKIVEPKKVQDALLSLANETIQQYL